MENKGIKCKICLQNLKIEKFHKIDLTLGEKVFKEELVKDICAECLDVGDLCVYLEDSKIKYNINHLNKYNEMFLKNYFKVVLDSNIEDFVTLSFLYERVVEECGLQTSERNFRLTSSTKMFKSVYFSSLKIPTHFNKENFQWFAPKKEAERFLVLYKNGSYSACSNCKIPKNQLDRLINQRWVICKDNRYYFYTNKERKMAICRTCGEVKGFSQFLLSENGKFGIGFECKDCYYFKNKLKYSNLDIEKKKKIVKANKVWRKNNKEKVIKYWKKLLKNPKYRAIQNLRKRLKDFLKVKNPDLFSKDIGCTKKQLIQHLESQFEEGMSWDNYGNPNGDHTECWHIDHIIPLSRFEGPCPNHYTNLRPMWGLENISKSNKIN